MKKKEKKDTRGLDGVSVCWGRGEVLERYV
jgi:hypothetical protein